MATGRATPVRRLLEMRGIKMSQPHYAEVWTLVGLLSKQPAKFGKLLLEIGKHSHETMKARDILVAEAKVQLAAIKKVYGWGEKELTEEWRAYVMGEAVKGEPRRPKPDAAQAETDEQPADDDTEPAEDAAADSGEKDTRLSMKDIQRLRSQHIFPGESRGKRRRAGTQLQGHGGDYPRASQLRLPSRPDRRDQGVFHAAAGARKMVAHQRRAARSGVRGR